MLKFIPIENIESRLFEIFPNRPVKQRFVNASLDNTIHHMKKFIEEGKRDERIVYLARIIAKNCDGRDFDCIAKAVYFFLIRMIKYQFDPRGVEWLQDCEVTLRKRSGDCDDFATLGSALLQAIGINTRLIIAQANTPVWNHVYLEYYSPRQKKWIPFDASEKKSVGWQSPNILETKVV